MRAVRDRWRERVRRCDVGDLGARLSPDPVALALEVVDVAVVHQTVDERGRDGTVVQHARTGWTRRPPGRRSAAKVEEVGVNKGDDIRRGGQPPRW